MPKIYRKRSIKVKEILFALILIAGFYGSTENKNLRTKIYNQLPICGFLDDVFGCQSILILTFFKSGASNAFMSKP